MIYLFYQSWNNTKTNHAGMKYMCQKLEQQFPEKYKSVEVATEKNTSRHNIFIHLINLMYKPLHKIQFQKKLKQLISSINIKPDDIIILTEYMDKFPGQLWIPKLLKNKFPNIKIYGLSHLVPSKLNAQFDKNDIKFWTDQIDGLITLGSSLTDYYINKGVSNKKILTTFHYVDDYYLNDPIPVSEFKVLVQGNQMRDVETLIEVVKSNPDVKFVICQGMADMSSQLSLPNVELKSFMDESDLRELMITCPVSLNIMKDTIGSNVIVTSMGMSQAMICSDVGSIRDYCNDSNCYFCVTVQDFSKAIHLLEKDNQLLNDKRTHSREISNNYKLELFEKELSSFILN